MVFFLGAVTTHRHSLTHASAHTHTHIHTHTHTHTHSTHTLADQPSSLTPGPFADTAPPTAAVSCTLFHRLRTMHKMAE